MTQHTLCSLFLAFLLLLHFQTPAAAATPKSYATCKIVLWQFEAVSPSWTGEEWDIVERTVDSPPQFVIFTQNEGFSSSNPNVRPFFFSSWDIFESDPPWKHCYRSAIKAAGDFPRFAYWFFTEWTYGTSRIGIVDSKSNPESAAEGDRRFHPTEKIFVCGYRITPRNKHNKGTGSLAADWHLRPVYMTQECEEMATRALALEQSFTDVPLHAYWEADDSGWPRGNSEGWITPDPTPKPD